MLFAKKGDNALAAVPTKSPNSAQLRKKSSSAISADDEIIIRKVVIMMTMMKIIIKIMMHVVKMIMRTIKDINSDKQEQRWSEFSVGDEPSG